MKPRTSLLRLLILALALPVQRAAAEPGPAAVTPGMELRGFFDVTLLAGRATVAGRDTSHAQFRLGQFDLFMVSRLSERTSFLGELVVEAEPGGSTRMDLERAHLRYSIRDELSVTAGRTHSPISLWNVAYHHGTLLQPTIDRPQPVRFEDDAGLLPLHAVGVELSGRRAFGTQRVEYTASLANGRGARAEAVQTELDENRDKSVGLSLDWSRETTWELRLGVSALRDRIPAPGGVSLREAILGLHFTTRTAWCEAIGEYFVVRESSSALADDAEHHAWYAVASFGHDAWHPYLSAESQRLDAADPYLAPTVPSLQRGVAGVRFDLSEGNVLKLEYRNSLEHGVRGHGLAVQTAFAF